MTVVLLPYTKENPDTIEFVTRLETETAATVFRCYTGSWDRAYEFALRALWPCKDELVIIEHDIVPTMESFVSMHMCERKYCTTVYDYVNWMRTTETEYFKTQIHYDPKATDRTKRHIEAQYPDEFCNMTGFGFIKFGRQRCGIDWDRLWKNGQTPTWKNLDGVVEDQLREQHVKFHIHWDKVRHDKPAEDYEYFNGEGEHDA